MVRVASRLEIRRRARDVTSMTFDELSDRASADGEARRELELLADDEVDEADGA